MSKSQLKKTKGLNPRLRNKMIIIKLLKKIIYNIKYKKFLNELVVLHIGEGKNYFREVLTFKNCLNRFRNKKYKTIKKNPSSIGGNSIVYYNKNKIWFCDFNKEFFTFLEDISGQYLY